MDKILKKWKLILDTLEINEENRREKFAQYCEHFQQMDANRTVNIETVEMRGDKVYSTGGDKPTLLPFNLRVLKELNNFDLTKDPGITETYSYRIKMKEEDYLDIKDGFGVDIISKLEGVILNEMILQLKDKDITIYSLVDNVQVIHEHGYDPSLTVRSRIRINN